MHDDLVKMCAKCGVSREAGEAYFESLSQHIAYVWEAGQWTSSDIF
jgi:hypothetical protein